MKKIYAYGMRLRGFSPGCQPKGGFVKRLDSADKKYYDILLYDRQLTEKELRSYELDPLCSVSHLESSDDLSRIVGGPFGEIST